MRIKVALALVAVLLVAPICAPEIELVEAEVEVYNLTSPGYVPTTGESVGIRVPLTNTGAAEIPSVGVLAQLLDKNGVVLQQRSLSLAVVGGGDSPVFEFQPFGTDVPTLIDDGGTGRFRITVNVGYADVIVHEHHFTIVSSPPDTSAFEQFADEFDAFMSYAPGMCPGIWSDTVSLLGAVELYGLDPLHPDAIDPSQLEPYVKHLSDELTPQIYDPDALGTEGPCGFLSWHPDTSTAAAVLMYLFATYGDDWGHDTRESLRRLVMLPYWKYLENENVYNKSIEAPTMRLLFGEAACHAPAWEHSWNQFSNMLNQHLTKGDFEPNDLHYLIYHLGNLGLLDALDSPVPKHMARTLFEWKALLSAHMYLPGGHIGTLFARRTPFFFPGTERERAMGPVVEALAVGSDMEYAAVGLGPHAVTMLASVVAARNPLPLPVRRLFLEKGDGYEGWFLQRPARSRSRYPGTLAFLGEGGAFAFAWHLAVLPAGTAAIASSYGAWTPENGNQEGATVRCTGCEQGFAQIYQWQACHSIDTDDQGTLICSSDPTENAKTSGYDAERMQVHRTRLSLFDPRTRTSRWTSTPTLPVPRGDERTFAYLPHWSHPKVGGEKIFPTAAGWYVGRVDDVFIAYRPLADSFQTTIVDGERLDGGVDVDFATLFDLDGRSGGITLLSTDDEFTGTTLLDFAAEMDARFWSFTAAGPNDGPVAETDYRADDGTLCRMKLEYMGHGALPGTERRYIDCSATLGSNYVEQTHDDFFAPLLGGQLMNSDFVSYDTQTDVMTVDVPTYPPISYDWGAVRFPPLETASGCEGTAYIEFAEPQVLAVTATALAPLPSASVGVTNAGFTPTTVAISFEGDDCTPGGPMPSTDWLSIPTPLAGLALGNPVDVALDGSTSGCEAGEYTGEVVFTSIDEKALEARMPVTLSVSP